MSQRVRVSIDRRMCAGHGRCYAIAPDIFGADDEGFAIVLAQPEPDQLTAVRSAAANCPERAVVVEVEEEAR